MFNDLTYKTFLPSKRPNSPKRAKPKSNVKIKDGNGNGE
jgi:hypothetical protein